MPFIEAPTTFYLGRRYDPSSNRLTDDVIYYDSRDLTTHSVVVGMTGSGKTGLCITLLEEAILDNIPAIVIDPKGDITNLMLTFPDLQPDDFRPWVNVDDARRAGMGVPQYSADVAQRWRDGLQSWGIVPERVMWMKKAAQYSIFTPGSDAGLPISILASLRAPRDGWEGNEEALREKLNGITTALLALAGLEVEPVKDPEHVLVSNIFEHAWRQGKDLTLEDIILQVQKPPFNKLGVFPIDDFMSERKRASLAMDLNNIIAAPSFQSWLNGEPLDIQSLLYQPNGRPRVSIFYIAHLSEPERMFITTLILENLLGWMRTLSGTTSLRALFYIDEMYGYFPPYPRNPPTKEPLTRMLKQARAFGLGMILATQNPGDLDYKGMTNAGTWFIGRLQSENDKQKVMAGLRQMATAQEDMNLEDVEDMIADIAPRVFLMRNVHDDDGPILIHTRWAMSFLRGPLTRRQVQELMKDQRQQLMQRVATGYGQQQQTAWSRPAAGQQSPAPPTPPGVPAHLPEAPPGMSGNYGNFNAQTAPRQPEWTPQPTVPSSTGQTNAQRSARNGGAPDGYSENQPPVSSSTSQYFLPLRLSSQQAIAEWEQRTGFQAQNAVGTTLLYKPFLLAQALVRFTERKANIYTARVYAYRVPDLQKAGIIHWEDYQADSVDSREIDTQPAEGALFGELPPGLTDSSRLKALEREVKDMLYNTARLTIPFNSELKIYGDPDGDFSEYQAQVWQAAREQRDAEVDKLSSKYASMMERLEEKLRRKELELRAEHKELKDRRKEELYTTGEALLSLWKGRTNYTLSRMSRATRYRRQTKEDISESYEFLEEVQEEMAELEQEFEVALKQTNDRWAAIANNAEEHMITPYKKDIQVQLFGIGWMPSWYMNVNGQTMMVEAY